MAALQLIRRPDWQERLRVAANARRSLPYRYGENDCWCFARALIEAMTDTLLLPEIDPPKSWIGAAKVMIERGWETVEDIMIEVLGAPIDPATSRAGDIVTYEFGGELHLAVQMESDALAPSPYGMVVIGRERWRRAWSVG